MTNKKTGSSTNSKLLLQKGTKRQANSKIVLQRWHKSLKLNRDNWKPSEERKKITAKMFEF